MISKRNFFTIVAMMAVIFGLFNFMGIAKARTNKYDVNDYALSSDELLHSDSVWKNTENGALYDRTVIYIGNLAKDKFGNTVKSWSCYTKRNLKVYNKLEKYIETAEEKPEAVLINPDCLNLDADINSLNFIMQEGVPVIFCKLPKAEIIEKSKPLQNILGIKKVAAKKCTIDGVKLFKEFLLGGEVHYIARTEREEKKQDMTLEVPWYQTGSGSKIYMVGMMEKEVENNELKNEELPALIWRSAYENSEAIAINGNFLEDISAIGILDAAMAELKPYEIYPVVNAQNLIIEGGPFISSNNDEEMQKIYSRNTTQVFRDVVFPSLIAVSEKSGFPMSCMMTIETDDKIDKPEYDTVVYYLKWLKEQQAEMGICIAADNSGFSDLTDKYSSFFNIYKNKYQYSGLCVRGDNTHEIENIFRNRQNNTAVAGVNTIVSENNKKYGLIDYVNDSVTIQEATSNGYKHTFTDDFHLRGLETALGYSNILVDMERVAYPQSDDDHWEKLSDELSRNIITYWKPFSEFDKTVISESDVRVRTFLSLNFSHLREGNKIILNVHKDKDRKAWFVLRTHGEIIEKIAGEADFKQIEKDAYLIEISGSYGEIYTKPAEEIYYK